MSPELPVILITGNPEFTPEDEDDHLVLLRTIQDGQPGPTGVLDARRTRRTAGPLRSKPRASPRRALPVLTSATADLRF
jgi:hypothetical protein